MRRSPLVVFLLLAACTEPPPKLAHLGPTVLRFSGTKTASLHLGTTEDWTLSSDAEWLSVSETEGFGEADLMVTVSRDGLEPGNYQATLTANTLARRLTAKVYMSFPDLEGNINASAHSGVTEGAPPLREGYYRPDTILVSLDPGGVAVSVGKAIERTQEPEPSEADYQAAARALAAEYGLELEVADFERLRFGARGQALEELLGKLAHDGRVEMATVDEILAPRLVPDDPRYTDQWHYPMIGLPEAWDITTGSEEIALAVIDSGVQPDHPDFAGRLVGGYDFVTNREELSDTNGHGTHVGGTMGAATNNGAGVAGVTWKNPLIGVRVLGDTGSAEDIVRGILFAAGIEVSNSAGAKVKPARAARVMNLSLGPNNPMCTDIKPSAESVQAVERVLAAGVVVVVASGNDGCNTLDDLSLIPGVISVSAVDRNGVRAPYSNAGKEVWISAPGGNTAGGEADGIISTYKGSEYKGENGTSMAAPHVAAVVGLMLSANPNLKPIDVRQILAQTAKPIAGADANASGAPDARGGMGHGLVDAAAAVRAAQAWTPGQSKYVAQLVDMSGNIVKQAEVDAGGNYRFLDVPMGEYKLRAGSDPDGDGTLGEAGELVGEAPVQIGDQNGDAEVNLDLAFAE